MGPVGGENPVGDEFTPLRAGVRRRKYLVLDLESKDGPTQRAGFTRPFMGGMYDGEHFQCFFDQDRDNDWTEQWYWPGGCVDRLMRSILRRKYSGWHIYAHNAGNFDYLFLLTWLMGPAAEAMGYRFQVIPVGSSIQVLDVWRGKRRHQRWRFLDSYRLIPLGLDRAAKTFGLGGKLEFDLNLPEWDPKWREYNEVDCVKLYDVLKRFHHYVEDVLLGEVGITTPSTAVKLLRRQYLSAPVQRNLDTHEFVRRGYFGGRVELFRREGKGLYYYDINSSYPAAMLCHMPGSHCSQWHGEPPVRFLGGEHVGFCQAHVVVPRELPIPPLPVKGDGEQLPGDKLVFPTGQLKGIWEWSELEQAMQMGCQVLEWGKSVWYEGIALFVDYVRELYAYRDKNSPCYDEGLAAIAKLMMNACYGKFGQKRLRRKLYRFDDPELPENAVPADQDPECLVWYAEQEMDAPYIMPQVAARVTAIARVRLLRYMLEAQALGGTVHYCDTDSLIVDVPMETSTALGGLKDELPEHGGKLEGRFLCPKLYLLQADGFEQVRAKGFKKRTRETFETLERGGAVITERLEKLGTLARAGFRRGPRMVSVPKRLHLEHGKRILHPDGTTTPHHVYSSATAE